MNNAAMSGTHYPLDKEPRGRNEDRELDSQGGRRRKVKISTKAAMESVSS